MLVSLAMALHGEKPIAEDGTIMNSVLAGPGGVELDVFKGRALLRNPISHSSHNPWYGSEFLRPTIVHFCGTDMSIYPYGQEILRLDLVRRRHWPLWLATLWSKVSYSWPLLGWSLLKDRFRPLYHRLLGPRRVRKSGRA
jgi:hypothetical protein